MKVIVSTLAFGLAMGVPVAYGQAPVAGAASALPKPTQALILPFAAISNPSATPGPSGAACPSANDTNSEAKPPDPAEVQKLTDTVSAELQKKLAKKMDARIGTSTDQPTAGTLVLAGCFIKIDPGNAAKRMAGMNMGSSHLGAHVVAKIKTADGLVTYKEFDAIAKGGKILPPLGPVGVATHAAAERRETLVADAKRLANDIAKNLTSTKPAN
jgi:Domain of unknown function (DUF4410)